MNALGRNARADKAVSATPTVDAFLEIDGLSLDFPIYHGGSRSLKKTVLSVASERFGPARSGDDDTRQRRGRVVVRALREITLSLRPGDRLGVVGRNGAGKSSLLRAMAGIYEPTRGRVHIGGTLSALLDTNFGMNLDLTGRENILLRGRYGGMNGAAIRRLETDVQEFAELGAFIDLPVRMYSSGMVVRLGFGMATAIAPQVLLMDEWFMAGDSAFQDKAHARLESVVRGAEIVVLTSHQVGVLKSWCTRLLWLDAGQIRADGPADEVVEQYLSEVRQ